MKATPRDEYWTEDDEQLASESADIIKLVRDHQPVPKIPHALERDIRKIARSHATKDVTSNWLIGQGPWVILVTLIVFAVAIMFLISA